ncbi:MAG: PSD1 and planctomycete cytochrome C domain-containing protein [Bryobacteraceae bacterium]
MPKRVNWLALMVLLAPWAVLYGQDALYETSVRPVLVENCLGCHNEKLKMSGLSLASRQSALAGGKRGPAAVPGKPNESRLLEAVNHRGDLRMPPGRRLEQSSIAVLEEWIRAGMVWPDATGSQPPPPPNHWSFLPPKRSVEPPVKNQAWVRSPIDRFILAMLEQENIQPSPEASAATLVRRVYLDLTGLPPSPEEVAAFIADKKSGAWERLVERLLASPHYGERWGRFWLDQARYADSDAGSRDEPRQIWRYRDWVIDAMNRDLPFDRFVVEQLAGDLLPNPSDEQLIATGFHRNSPIQIEAGTDREQYRVEAVFDRVDTTGTVFLGLSVGCARCHDHKFDPVSHREYYQLFAFFNNSDDWGEGRPRFNVRLGNLHDVHGPLLEFATPETLAQRDELRARMKEIDREIDAYQKERSPGPGDAFVKERNAEIQRIKKSLPAIPATMIMRELPEPRQTHIFLGGDYTRPGDRVRQGTPAFLHSFPERANANRLDFTRWLVDPSNPLLARVAVNRIWQQYFGRGIVETENDFGTQGTPPTHPELLDWLATAFVSGGWSQKAIHRLIVNSAVYRQASEVRKDLREKDPRNLLLARQTRLRLDSEIVRDVTLAASGLLNGKVGGPSVFPPQPASAMTASQIAKSWTVSTGPDRYRRGMYTFFWRLTPHPALVVFDSPNSMTTCTRRTRSNTPLQALALLNETAFHEAAQALGTRLMRDATSDNDRLLRLFQLCLSREPKAAETERLRRLLALERDAMQTRPEDGRQLIGPNAPAGVDPTEMAVWTALARVALNLDEFITRE